VRFLRIFPYAYYFCRKAGGCDCRSLDHKFKARRACHNCGCASCRMAGPACLLPTVHRTVSVLQLCDRFPARCAQTRQQHDIACRAHACTCTCPHCLQWFTGMVQRATTAGGTSMWPTPSRRGGTAARGAPQCGCSRCVCSKCIADLAALVLSTPPDVIGFCSRVAERCSGCCRRRFCLPSCCAAPRSAVPTCCHCPPGAIISACCTCMHGKMRLGLQHQRALLTRYRVRAKCRTVVLRKDRFDDREMDFYEALYTQSQAQFGAYVESGTVLNNYAHIFDLLIRLRQVRDNIWQPDQGRCGRLSARCRLHAPQCVDRCEDVSVCKVSGRDICSCLCQCTCMSRYGRCIVMI
jgi:hypothetical protein